MPTIKRVEDPRSIARAYAKLSLQALAEIIQHSQNDHARVAAVKEMLDRGYGRPPQDHTGDDDGEIRVTIRHISSELRGEPRTIEHEAEPAQLIDGNRKLD